MRRTPFVVIAAAAVLALTACDPAGPATSPSPHPSASSASPTPTPTPTPTTAPALADLVLTANGMGTLVFGEAPSADPAQQMIAEDPAACAEFAPAGTPEATRWRPIAAYLAAGETFGVSVAAGTLERIDLFCPSIPTDGGIRIGATLSDLVTAHPGAALVAGSLTDIYVVTGTHGTLQIEVARTDSTGYWPAGDIGHVVFIHAVETGYGTFSVVASENIAGGCL
ncbi:MAG: hypothetical protein ABIQ01_08715 [Pseudolysinimonas sp.]